METILIAPAIFVLAIFTTAWAVWTSSSPSPSPKAELKIFLISFKETFFFSEIILDIFNRPRRRFASEIVGKVPPLP